MCSLDNETIRIWKNVVAKLNSWLFRVEEAPELTKAGDLECQLLAWKDIDREHVDEDYTQVLLKRAFKKEDRRRHQRAFTPEGSDITLDTHVSYMTVDPNVHDPPPPLKARQLHFRLPEIMDYRPGPASVATSFRVGPDYATPFDIARMQSVAQWATLTSRPGRRMLRGEERLEEGELPEDDNGASDTDTIRGFDRRVDSNGHPEVDGGATPRAHYTASVAPSESDARTHLAHGTDETDSIFASPTEMAIARMEQEERNAYVPEGLEDGELIDY
ncbi:hypothetical protein I302_104277 [Kwoniella bestiolae CBS 10118]|uniref:Uncharacterized protein n=1 Tax=Kwoniella bestiolae CBS 10118 TaxID=1296100 RepID=A0A1B9GAT6_9TREE|nr:hypothetical protein I302_02985 [Kwoniella bestiolae CBS 10118]OCF28134.1 hypothetical protein I302_02985 [Kwoniella bestiolae CBS 10118]